MDVVLKYLRLDERYCRHLGGLCWSETEDVLEYEDGRTFAFNKEIATFLQGFGSIRPLIHFGHILHLLDILHGRRAQADHLVGRLAQAFRDSGMPVRNAGVLCALLCRAVPRYPEAIAAGQLANRLCNTVWPIRHMLAKYHDQLPPADVPPLEPNAFELEIWGELWGHTDEELRSWLRHGHLPLKEAGEEVARQMLPPEPRTLMGIVDELLQRPRLAGVRPFVRQMISALTLPPRRLAREEIPVGGYADVATHGQVEQILPSQFALDDLEFVRRYAERELLYFRREEPNQRTKQELVVVLDQGVRTWGEVRLVLSAAVMALAKHAERRRLPFLLAVTSLPGQWLDPLQIDGQALGDALEASDLSAHPGLALEWALEMPCSASRDIVLLTHPRSLKEEEVRSAMKRLLPECRLFALTVDGAGTAVFDEIKRGVPCEVRRFQVDLKPLDVELPRQDTTPFGYRRPWSGDIEPIGFPFRFGPGDPLPPHLFQFDAAGDWLLAAGRNGMLYAWKTDGSDMEILPRGVVGSALLTKPDAVLGVAGGFVVAGIVNNQRAAVHYDFTRRVATAHRLGGAIIGLWQYEYVGAKHVVVARNRVGAATETLDLATGACYSSQEAVASWVKRSLEGTRPDELRVLNSPVLNATDTVPRPSLQLNSEGQLLVARTQSLVVLHPKIDGQPLLKGCKVIRAECRANTLAVLATGFRNAKPNRLCVFDLSEKRLLTNLTMGDAEDGFTLSCNGELLCRKIGACSLRVEPLFGGAKQGFHTAKGGYSSSGQFFVSRSRCVIQTGKENVHLLAWHRNGLAVHKRRGKYSSPVSESLKGLYTTMAAVPYRKSAWSHVTCQDVDRFKFVADKGLLALGDRFGQIAFCDRQGNLVCMAFAFRDTLALWMPDGTCYGPASITGRPESPQALQKIGQALWKAEEGGNA